MTYNCYPERPWVSSETLKVRVLDAGKVANVGTGEVLHHFANVDS